MPVRPYRPPLRTHRPWAYHAGAVARGTVDKAGKGVARSAERASVDKIAQAINLGVDAFIQLLIVLGANGLVIFILVFWLIGQMTAGGGSMLQLALKLVGLNPSVFGLNSAALQQVTGDMNDLGAKVEKGQVFNRFDGGTVTVNSGWGPRNTGIPGASRYHKGIDLALEAGYPVFAWVEMEVTCTESGGYGNMATLKPNNGQVYQAAHLSVCDEGAYVAGQIYGRVGSTGVSSGNHLHWNQKSRVGQLVHPQTNPLQATLTGKWPGGGSSATGGIDIDFIKKLEGSFHPTAYLDGSENGKTRWSWGYGTKAPGPGQTITEEEAHKQMASYIEKHCLPIIPQNLAANQQTAAASLCYNAGPGVKTWAIWKDIEAGGAASFTSYTRSTTGNLTSRRQKEQDMWEGK